MEFLYEVYMDNIEEITKRVEDTQKEVAVKEDNVKIAPTEPSRQYSSMTMPMTQFISNADINDDTVNDEVTQKIQSEVNNALKDDKFAEGEILEIDYAPIKEQRKSWRKQINDYEAAVASKEDTIKLL